MMLPCRERDPLLTKKWLRHLRDTLKQNSVTNVKFVTLLSCRARDFLFNSGHQNRHLLSQFDSIISFEPIANNNNRRIGSQTYSEVNRVIRYCDRQRLNSEMLQDLSHRLTEAENVTIIHSYSTSTGDAMKLIANLVTQNRIRVVGKGI